MTVCRECNATEQGYETIEEDGEEYEVCAVCGSDEISEVNEDDPNEDR